MHISPTQFHSLYKRFTISRVKAWKPKIEKNLKTMIEHATDEPTVQLAISRLDANLLKPSGLALTIKDIYIDAGRVWGAHVYQLVKKEGDKATATSQKALGRIGFNEEMINEIVSYLQLHDLNMVSEITDTIKDWILEQLIEGQRDGLSIQEIADNMIADDFPANRAIIIARTETIKAANFGAVQGAKKTGFLTEKLWISANDWRTRRIPKDEFSHIAMHLKTADMDKPFLVPNRNGGHDSLQHPGDPSGDSADVIQCRCTVGFNVMRDERGLPIRKIPL